MKRRDFVRNFSLAGSSAIFGGCASPQGRSGGVKSVAIADGGGDPNMRGPFPILSTPYDSSGEVDFPTLAREAKFVADCGCNMIWPQAGDAIDLLTFQEKLDGMEAIANALQNANATVAFGCSGKDVSEMSEFVRHVERIAGKYKNARPRPAPATVFLIAL